VEHADTRQRKGANVSREHLDASKHPTASMRRWSKELEALRDENRRLREALEAVDKANDTADYPVSLELKGALRAAGALLTEAPTAGKEPT
jgi:Mg-chelatase subunit ChlI